MTRPAALIAAIADAVLAVVLGFGSLLAIATIGWLVSGAVTTTPWTADSTLAVMVWTLGLGGNVGVTLDPAAFPQLGIAVPLNFVISVAPLAITAALAAWGWRSGMRLAHEPRPWLGAVVGILAFAFTNALALAIVPTVSINPDITSAVVIGTLVFGVPLVAALRPWRLVDWQRALGRAGQVVREELGAALRLAGSFLVGLSGLAALAALVLVTARMGNMIGLMQSLQFDIWGTIGATLVQLLYLPTILVWLIAWLLGTPIALGAGSEFTLGGVTAGPLPIVPLFGLLPDASSPFLWALVAVPFIGAAIVTMRMRGSRDVAARSWWERSLAPVVAALITGIVLALTGFFASGSLGPGRLGEFGPNPGLVLLACLGVLGLGALAGQWLPLEPKPESVDATGDDDDALLADEPRSAEASWWQRAGTRLTGERDVDDEAEDDEAEDDEAEDDEAEDARPAPATSASRRPAAEPAMRDDNQTPTPASKEPHRSAPGDLGDVLRRPGEVDIYADIDDDELN